MCQSREPGNTQRNTGQHTNTSCSQSYVVLFQMVQHAENRDTTEDQALSDHQVLEKFDSHCILGLAQPTASQPLTSSPSMLLHCSESASGVLDYQISRRGAKVHRNECSSCLGTYLTEAPRLPHVTARSCGWIQQLPWEVARALPASQRRYIFLRKGRRTRPK